jgi:hypothetical protein
MNARKFLNVRVSLTVTALALCGALAFSAMTTSCAGGGGGGAGGSGAGGAAGSGAGGSGVAGSTGGGTSCTPGADSVCFATGKASGVLTGYGWIALGSLDTATSPTCATAVGATTTVAIDNADPCNTSTTWNSDSALCITGSIPMVVAANYTANWGLQIGVNSIDPPATSAGAGTVAKAYKTITFTTSGTVSPTGAAVRAEIHRVQDPAATTYCANMVSGTPINLTSFNTACWDGSGTMLTSADVTTIDKIGVQISSDTAAAYTVTNFCLSGISFGM